MRRPASSALRCPQTKLRFYRRDDDGQLQFVGENTIDHTPRNETVRVTTGNSFDLVSERKQTNFHVDTGDKCGLAGHLKSSCATARRTYLTEIARRRTPLPLDQLADHRQVRRVHQERLANHLEFRTSPVKPDEERTVSYTVRYSW